ncbi:MAG TPA: hypothetical protein VK705_10640 [Ferruginibacter sp.]|jgi:hypothetical protein|nr:hypothetical protein [Ferruginibacter sp.]
MKEVKTKIMILILTLYVVFDPSIEKIKHGKEYLHSLFSESFDDAPNPTKKSITISIDSLQNEVVDLLRK